MLFLLTGEERGGRRRTNAKGSDEASQKHLREYARTYAREGERRGHVHEDQRECGECVEKPEDRNLAERGFEEAHHVLALRGRVHGDQIVGHGDDGEEKDEEQGKRDQRSPLELGVAPTNRPYPSSDEKDRCCRPGEIEKKLHSGQQ